MGHADATTAEELPAGHEAEGATKKATAESTSGAPTGSKRPFLLLTAAVVSVASLFGPLSASGLWDPHELKVADLARRIALNLLGGPQSLALQDAVNSVPTLGELARGQLPFTSVALGFRLFGLHEWAGRLPLAVWGLVGIVATYALVARLADRAAGAFSALALATMPLYFLHSRTILGDIVTMAAMAVAVCGLGLAVFDRSDEGRAPVRRGLWALLGLVGLAAGFGSRGALIGVAVPALGVGLSWTVVRLALPRAGDRLSAAVGILSFAVGAVALVLGLRALGAAEDAPSKFSMWVGAPINPPRQMPTFDEVIHYLGHGLFPWSAVVPFAVGRLLRAPSDTSPGALERGTALRVMLLVVSAAAFGMYGWMAKSVGPLPFGGVFALAAIAGVAFSEFEKDAPGSRALAMGVAALAILFFEDFREIPEKGLSAFVVEGARFPDSFKELGTKILKLGTLSFVAVFFVAFMDKDGEGKPRFVKDEYLGYWRTLRSLWNGNLWFSMLVSEAALIGYALLSFLSHNKFHWKQFEGMSPVARTVAQTGWLVVPIVLLLLPPLAMIGRDVARAVLDFLPVRRAMVALLSVVAFGAVLSFGYYPALAAQISPKEVFEAYENLGKDERLALLGVGSGSASYYAGRDVPTFNNAPSAFEWLMQGDERRWLVTRASDLPQLNSMYRGRVKPARNLPVLDARSSEIMLVSNRLEAGEKNDNPFNAWILDAAPSPSHRVDGNFGNQLDNLGWDVTTTDGQVVDSVVPGKAYQFRIYYKVVAPISGNWETFIHIDGFQRRYNGDHPTLEGKYPLHLWRVGDYVADIHEFTLEPNFTPGDYSVFYGLFIGSRRLEVKKGPQNDNRLEAGRLRVR